MPEVIEYKCPCCGGAVSFNAAGQNLKCPYCDTEFDIDALDKFEKATEAGAKDDNSDGDSFEGAAERLDENGMTVYICESCGGEIVTADTTAATSCPFCGNPTVIPGRLSGDLKPDLVIPFKLDKAAAVSGLGGHLKGKRLLPKVFKTANHIKEVKGIYVPFWLFDSDADFDLLYKATRVRMWSDSRYDYTETKFYSVTRVGAVSFDKVPADGLANMPDDLMESLEPYDNSAAVDFSTAYLSGFLADRYDVTSEQCSARVGGRMRATAEQMAYSSVMGYNTVTKAGGTVNLKNGKVRYALYPVWILNTEWKGQKYTFAMNGQTGKFVGDLPVDKGLFWRWFLGLFASVSAAVLLLACLFFYLL